MSEVTESIYQLRMKDCYPQVIQTIMEFNAIIDGEYPEFELLDTGREQLISDAYLFTMGEERISQWEKILNITPLETVTLQDRRDVILARIRGQGKLNTALIKAIVQTFTNADCETWFEDSTIHIRVGAPKDYRDYSFDNLIAELQHKVPAHLALDVAKSWQYWINVYNNYEDWTLVRAYYPTWENVLTNTPKRPNQLDVSQLDVNFYLGKLGD